MSKKDTPWHRLFKQLKAQLITWEEMTPEQIQMMRKHYPFLFKNEFKEENEEL